MKLLLNIVILLCTIVTFAQNKLMGKVTNENNEPISEVKIEYTDQSQSTITRKNGTFEIIFKKDSVLTIYHEKHEPLDIEIHEDSFLQIILKEIKDLDLDELTIDNSLYNIHRSDGDNTNTQLINKSELTKAACCSLAESFETNPSIDVNFTDAVTGTKQIKMLGLKSPYILIAEENISSIKGASQAFGLSFIPGTWIQSIQLTKGAGSVINGFESISGQINYEIIKPDTEEQILFNTYISQSGRHEINAHFSRELSKNWSTSLFAHRSKRATKNDQNNDGFLDNPLGQQINLINRWQYTNENWFSLLSIKHMTDQKQAGQLDFNPKNKLNYNLWGSEIKVNKTDIASKIAYIFPDQPFQSLGWQNSANYYKQDSYFGKNQYFIQQKSFLSNLMFKSIINNIQHQYTAGLSFTYDDFKENVDNYGLQNYDRKDYDIGTYCEYTYDNLDDLAIVSGLRVDYSNRLGLFITPRLHIRYNPWSYSVFRASIGKGKRLANIFSENQQLFASSRKFEILNSNNQPYGLKPETAWNYGASFSQTFEILDKDAQLIIDFYRTDFVNQTIIDVDNSAKSVLFYNLEGQSFANSLQIELNYNLAKHLNLRSAYKYYDVTSDFKKGRLTRALQAKNRLFANIEYQTHLNKNEGNWKFDATCNWLSSQRIPFTGDLEIPYQRPTESEDFFTINAQITKVFNPECEFYLGVENLLNYKQERAIINPENPFSDTFDSTMIYGPVFGRMIYAGLRFKLNHNHENH